MKHRLKDIPEDPDPRPEAGDLKTLQKIFGIARTTAYELNRAGEIRFIRLRKRGHLYSRVLVDFDSVRDYLKRCIAADLPSREDSGIAD